MKRVSSFSKNHKYTETSLFLSPKEWCIGLVNALSKRFDTLYIERHIIPITKRFYKKYIFPLN